MRNGSVDWLVENGYCARCRVFVVDAWFCLQCALDDVGPHEIDDQRAATFTRIGHDRQQLVDRGAIQRQFTEIQALPLMEFAERERGYSRSFSSNRRRLRRIRKVLSAGPGRIVDAKSPVQAIVDFVPRLEDRRAKRRALKALAA